jgi:ABC-type thiamine transport system substrate-binding protein
MVEAMNTLIGQKNNPQADIVIGLDSSMVARAKDQKILYATHHKIKVSNHLNIICAGNTP